jgi:hydroxyacylglutathione hydrolase
MTLEIQPLLLGPAGTNTYLAADTASGEAVVIDPAWDGGMIVGAAQERGWRITQLWYTHAHFDHFGGAAEIADLLQAPVQVALHPKDRRLWMLGGGGGLFGFKIRRGPAPTIDLAQVKTLEVGATRFEVRHAPGHTPGLCIFYCAAENVLFSGDLIFRAGVGRTDLPGGNWNSLLRSIREQVFSLPEGTRILPGHGPETTVGDERLSNPFFVDE